MSPELVLAVCVALLVVQLVGALLLEGMEWVMTCPWCRRVLRKRSLDEPWTCEICGWSR